MAKNKIKKTVTLKKFESPQSKKGLFSRFKLTESYTSLALGAIAVLVVGILIFSFARGNRNTETSSTNDNQKTGQESNGSNTSSTYTIKPGDDLWSISEEVYKDGYKWVEIAKINKLEDPGIIHVGNKLIIPTLAPSIAKVSPTPSTPIVAKAEPTPTTQATIMQNNSITGNTYKIKEGDNLWDICVRAYGDGYKWPEIARVNNLENPNLIFVDQVLNLPR